MQATAPSAQIQYVINEMMLVSGDSHEDALVPSFGDHAIEFSVTTAPAFALRRPDCVFLIRDRAVDYAAITDPGLFQLLVNKWHAERGATSSITAMAMCRAYLEIIGMGPPAISLILRQMYNEGDEPDMWFVALQVLTREDPVTDEIRGDFKAMSDCWLQWAADAGYAW
jgi:hypothetical protein